MIQYKWDIEKYIHLLYVNYSDNHVLYYFVFYNTIVAVIRCYVKLNLQKHKLYCSYIIKYYLVDNIHTSSYVVNIYIHITWEI